MGASLRPDSESFSCLDVKTGPWRTGTQNTLSVSKHSTQNDMLWVTREHTKEQNITKNKYTTRNT
jgi:uncharacterized protein YeaC (DUF1315 family)